MLAACKKALPSDILICVAAVADWRPADMSGKKIKKDGSKVPPLTLEENPDILKTLATSKKRPELVIGFAAETNDVLEHATAKRLRKTCDWIVANDVSGDIMGGDYNEMILVTESGHEAWPRLTKADAAKKLAHKIAEHFK